MSTPHLESNGIQQAITLLRTLYDELQRYREEWRRYRDIQVQLLVELRARARNADSQEHNGLMQRFSGTNVSLIPLADLRTGEVIERFPATAEEISALDGNESRRILEALGLPTEGVPLIVMRSMILQLAAGRA
ncbi:hypothetical protein N5P37_005793 [Trichoderma harzianum]|uniref:Uncharacterized protein n=1 Tax=Trichoderma harzianum CBS 226.95 TaxID=983964 RepID=A0A2T3ZS93_TRIHA|nr:hypothetical protein M431DRAFT_11530 [Trichoderma harzianum CBS 226.95]KAK0760854.1 hypothetical protein N5P37_005793 [Trichoderma harzianum]PKK51480.1 hypothetical protein CI102_4223 [Trichoderma harzianum]PTB47687.1 hypothetical protein M431DRAFT_11530 [Trichoderma harzianum CBS 226.95]